MKHLKTLVLMQLRDKIDLSVFQDKKGILRTVILSLLKFVIITGVTFLILYLCTQFSIFFYSETSNVMILVLAFSLILSLISCTVELMKSLYFAEDNLTLITLPVNANNIFVSKIIVFYIYEIKRSFSFLIPITLACCMALVYRGCCSPVVFLYMWVPIFFIVSLPVLIGALFSIPVMFIYKFLKKYQVVEFILFVVVLGLLIWAVVVLIDLIPANIDLMNQWPSISKFIREVLLFVEDNLVLTNHLTRTIIGEKVVASSSYYSLQWFSLVKLLILLVANVGLFIVVYFLSRPLFFKMMSKNFEVDKNSEVIKKNTKRNKYITFINKEFMINLRTIDISVNYLMVYIIVPILIFLLNKLYAAMDTKELGNILIYTFNVLLICLPLLASNSLVATYYSREGRAGYMKKSKPIIAAYPLLAKLFFNMIFSIPSVFITVGIFGHFANLGVLNTIIFGFAILILHYGHMLWSAMMDVVNPQNEQYATTGDDYDNPNETKSTILAFVISIIYAVCAYKLLSESILFHNGFTMGMVKLLLISSVLCGYIAFLFAKRVKAYYYDLQGR